MGKYDNRPYPVGKGKPPEGSRWKPGQSGNPRGPKRRGKAEDPPLSEILAEILSEKVTVTINNKETKLSKKRLIVLGLVRDAASGTPAQRLAIFNSLAKFGAFESVPSDEQPDPRLPEERVNEVLEQLAAEYERDKEMARLYDHGNRVEHNGMSPS